MTPCNRPFGHIEFQLASPSCASHPELRPEHVKAITSSSLNRPNVQKFVSEELRACPLSPAVLPFRMLHTAGGTARFVATPTQSCSSPSAPPVRRWCKLQPPKRSAENARWPKIASSSRSPRTRIQESGAEHRKKNVANCAVSGSPSVKPPQPQAEPTTSTVAIRSGHKHAASGVLHRQPGLTRPGSL
jgi:hypothetical protein